MTDPVEAASRLMEALRADLSAHTTEGYAYRVDLRLRPYGSSGQLVFTAGRPGSTTTAGTPRCGSCRPS